MGSALELVVLAKDVGPTLECSAKGKSVTKLDAERGRWDDRCTSRASGGT
jgi:hypothetical protein